MASDHADTPSDDPTDHNHPTVPVFTDVPPPGQPPPGKPAKATGKKAGDRGAEDVAALKAEVERLKAENRSLRAGKPVAAASRLRPAEPATPGEGPVLWEGTLEGDPTAPRFKFRGPESEAEAREAFVGHAGILSTDKKVRVTRADGSGEGGEDAEADAETQESKPKKASAKTKAAKKKQ
jgi:hypothetical protein